ncbi:hypothetical protein [Pseudomonas paeninsulae]|uniref:hypothetical protein n=1 Tax=Pseudomonas paeninsulae TaxID=3110772 RepID=UPI002D7A3A2C|nr:hypothetical protein [Pseudomonas sp. IT1137]
MNRSTMLSRLNTEADRMQEIALAIGSIAGILRRDALMKSNVDMASGLTLAELDGLGCALALIGDKMYCDGDSLDVLTSKQLEAGQ